MGLVRTRGLLLLAVTTRLIPPASIFPPPLKLIADLLSLVHRLVTEKTVTMKLYYLEQSGKRLPISLSLQINRGGRRVSSNVSSRKNRDNETLLSRT